MCTAVVYRNGKTYCGRNLDNSCSYGEEIVVMPRNFPLRFRHADEMKHHHAIVGTASVMKGVPLYYDAMNEEGVWAAGLNFVGNAIYSKASGASGEVAHFEFIFPCSCRGSADIWRCHLRNRKISWHLGSHSPLPVMGREQ